MVKRENSRLVYSTENESRCPACGRSLRKCSCTGKKKVEGNDGTVRIGRSTKGRRGRGVTVITGVPLEGDALLDLARELKKKCGTGGTLKKGVIEIQGDHRSLLMKELEARKFKVRLAGG